MSSENPDPMPDPFLGLFGDLSRMLGGSQSDSGPVRLDVARQFALWAATGGGPEANVDPLVRIRLEELARIAELHVSEITGLPISSGGGIVSVEPCTPGQWALQALEAYTPLLVELGSSLGSSAMSSEADADPINAAFGGLAKALGPVMVGVQSGFLVGNLAQQAFGRYELPIPWAGGDALVIVSPTVDAFAHDWSIQPDDLRLWLCIRELASHAVLSRTHIRGRLLELLRQYVGGFQADPDAIAQQLGGFNPNDLSSISAMTADPQALLGAMETDAQRATLTQLHAAVAAVLGYVDWVLDTATPRLLPNHATIAEALKRRRVEETEGSKFVKRLLGLDLSDELYASGEAFIAGIIERDASALTRLCTEPNTLPTPAELAAPGLWLARIEL